MKLSYLLFAFAVMILTCSPAWAGDTDPSGQQLRALTDNYLKTAPPGDEIAEHLRKAESGNDYQYWLIPCGFEVATGIGAIIWGNRMYYDNCRPSSLKDPSHYCAEYSKRYNHWTWDPDSFKRDDFECTR